MKKSDLATSIALVPIDFLMLVAAGLTSYGLRYQGFITRYRPVFFDYPISEFTQSLLLVSTLGILIFAFSGSYQVTSRQRLSEIFSKTFFGVSTTILIVIVAVFLRREIFSSRFVVLLAWATATLYVFIGRLVVYKIKSVILRKGIGTHGLVLIGSGKPHDDLADYFKSNPQIGYRVIARYNSFDAATRDDILRRIAHREVDEILDTREAIERGSFVDTINFCHEHGLNFRYLAGLFQTKTINIETDSVAGYPIIQINRTPLHGWRRVYKRCVDICVAVFALAFFLPFGVLIAVLIKIDSPGPVFARLSRVGRNGRIFTLYKFRSMVRNAHELKNSILNLNERSDGPLFKMKNDPRITRVGRMLRRSSLDELPQLWNVLIGDMSLVGPRPHEPQEVRQYETEYRSLLSIKPGMTGLAQVSGRSNLFFREEVTIDLYYIENWSFILDIQILLKTIVVVFRFSDAA